MITLDSEISTIGGWSTVYAIKGDPTRCAKVLAQHRRYKGEFPDPAMIARKKYGIADMLRYELDNHSRLMAHVPADMARHFVTFYGIDKTNCGREALVMELVTDDTGAVAKNLDANTRPLSHNFFQTLERIRRDVLLRHAIDHFGIACRNILVRDQDCPVLIDFQNSAARHRGQFWLKLPFFIRRKITRKFQRVYRDQSVPDFTKYPDLADISQP
jgi:RIO kinase 1